MEPKTKLLGKICMLQSIFRSYLNFAALRFTSSWVQFGMRFVSKLTLWPKKGYQKVSDCAFRIQVSNNIVCGFFLKWNGHRYRLKKEVLQVYWWLTVFLFIFFVSHWSCSLISEHQVPTQGLRESFNSNCGNLSCFWLSSEI